RGDRVHGARLAPARQPDAVRRLAATRCQSGARRRAAPGAPTALLHPGEDRTPGDDQVNSRDKQDNILAEATQMTGADGDPARAHEMHYQEQQPDQPSPEPGSPEHDAQREWTPLVPPSDFKERRKLPPYPVRSYILESARRLPEEELRGKPRLDVDEVRSTV